MKMRVRDNFSGSYFQAPGTKKQLTMLKVQIVHFLFHQPVLTTHFCSVSADLILIIKSFNSAAMCDVRSTFANVELIWHPILLI